MLETVRVRGRQPEDDDCGSIISEATRSFNYYISRLNCLFIFMGSLLSIIIICAISSISSSTSIQLFSEEGIIHRLGEGFYHHKIQ